MRISDWSSDVCSSYLADIVHNNPARHRPVQGKHGAHTYDAQLRRTDRKNRDSPGKFAHQVLFVAGQVDLIGMRVELRTPVSANVEGADYREQQNRFFDEACQLAVLDLARISRPHGRSEEHTSELQSLMRNSYAVFCLKKKQQH